MIQTQAAGLKILRLRKYRQKKPRSLVSRASAWIWAWAPIRKSATTRPRSSFDFFGRCRQSSPASSAASVVGAAHLVQEGIDRLFQVQMPENAVHRVLASDPLAE